MATIENIRQRACVVRDEEAEQQNTASRVGGLLVDMACALSESIPWGRVSATAYAADVRLEYDTVSATGAVTRRSIDLPAASTSNAGVMTAAQAQQLASLPSQVAAEAQELLRRLQGRSDESDASTDPFVWIGDFAPEAGEAENYMARINAALDALCTLDGGADNRRWCGRLAGTAYGNRFEAVQMALSYAGGRYVQVVAGCVGIASGGASLSFGVSEYAVFWRLVEGGVPEAWRRYGGGAQQDVAASAADGRFVYSSGVNNKSVLSTVMSAAGTGLLQVSGKLVFRAHWWNPKGTAGKYFSTEVPCATIDKDGAMSKQDKARVDALWLRPEPLVVEPCLGCEADLMELDLARCSDQDLAYALGVDDGVSAYNQITKPLLSGRPLLLRSGSEKATYFSAWQASPLVCSLTVYESAGADPAQYTYRLRLAFTGLDGSVRRLQCRLSFESVVRETWI